MALKSCFIYLVIELIGKKIMISQSDNSKNSLSTNVRSQLVGKKYKKIMMKNTFDNII